MSPFPGGQLGNRGITPTDLKNINTNKDIRALESHGFAKGVASKLNVSLSHGHNSNDAQKYGDDFGTNTFKSAPPTTFLEILLDTLRDPTLILLMFAASISTALGLGIKEERERNAWIEGG